MSLVSLLEFKTIQMTTGNPTIDYNWEGKSILIAEDEIFNFRLLEVMLSRSRAIILHGNTGLETLHLYQANPKIDLILMDIKMPDIRMDVRLPVKFVK